VAARGLMVMAWRGVEALGEAQRVVSVVRGLVSGRRAYGILKRVTLHSRVQGSRGILEAARDVEEFLVDELPDIVEVDEFTYTGKAMPEWMKLPVHWDLEYAALEVGGYTRDSRRSPTLAAAHTPPSDGWVEAEIVVAGDPLDPSFYEANRDKAVLVYEHHAAAYRLAAEAGVPILVLSGKDRSPEAHPYYGLFLTPEEAEKYTTVAVTLPPRIAGDAEGKRIRAYIDADIGGPGRVPVVAAWMGDREEPGPVVFAHLCHPAPGANDNASGVATAIEAFLALAEAVDRGLLPQPEATVRLVLTAEYTGSTLSMEGWLGPLASSLVNLDMVGRSESLAGDPSLYIAPFTWGASKAGPAFYDVATIMGWGIGARYYSPGSDHDVALAYNVDSLMANQWPDPYYHSDWDDADTVSPGLLGKTALAAAATLHLEASGYTPTWRAASTVIEGLVARHTADGDPVAAKIAAWAGARRYNLAPMAGPPEWKPPRDDRVVERRVPLLVSPLLVEMGRGLDEAIEFYRRLVAKPLYREVLSREVFYAAMNGYTVSRLLYEAAGAYGTVKARPEAILEGLALLEDAGLVRLS